LGDGELGGGRKVGGEEAEVGGEEGEEGECYGRPLFRVKGFVC